MADQRIPTAPPYDERTKQLPQEWQLFIRELLRRVADLERRVAELEAP